MPRKLPALGSSHMTFGGKNSTKTLLGQSGADGIKVEEMKAPHLPRPA
jgi:hypothetical protein